MYLIITVDQDIRLFNVALASIAQWIESRLWTKGSLVQFPVRAHAWIVGQVSSGSHMGGNNILMFLSSFSLPSPLSKNKQNL